MKRLNFTTIVLVLSLHAYAQTYLVQVKPKWSLKWGYANEKGEMVIAPQYHESFPFSEDGFAAVTDPVSEKYFFINTRGEKLKTVIPYCSLIKTNNGNHVDGFSSGLAAVRFNNKWGYLDTNGKMAIYPKYNEANVFSGGYTTIRLDTKYLVVDSAGHEFEIKAGNIKSTKKFTNGLAPFKGENGLMGFIRTDGTIAIEPKYKSVGDFINKIAWVKTKKNKLGYINSAGQEIIAPQYAIAHDFDQENTIALVKSYDEAREKHYSYYINASGEIIKPKIKITKFSDFSNGLAKVEENGKFGFINSSGQWVIQPQFADSRDFKNGFAAVKIGTLWGLINTKGEIVAQPQFGAMKDVELIR